MLTMRNEDVCPLLEVAASIMTLWPDRFSSSMGIGLQVESLSHIPFDMRNSRTYVFDNVAGLKPWQLRPRRWERRSVPRLDRGGTGEAGKTSAQLPLIDSAVLSLLFFKCLTWSTDPFTWPCDNPYRPLLDSISDSVLQILWVPEHTEALNPKAHLLPVHLFSLPLVKNIKQ